MHVLRLGLGGLGCQLEEDKEERREGTEDKNLMEKEGEELDFFSSAHFAVQSIKGHKDNVGK